MNVLRRVGSLLVVSLLLVSLLAVPFSVGAGAQSGTPAAPQVAGAVAFTGTGNVFPADHTLVEVRFDRAVNNSSVSQTDVGVKLATGSVVHGQVSGGAVGNDSEIVLDLGSSVTPAYVQNVTFNASGTIDDTNGHSYSGSKIRTAPVTTTSSTLSEGDTSLTAYKGETVAIVGDNANEGLYIHSLYGNDFVGMYNVTNDGQVYAFHTNGRPLDRYQIGFDQETAYPSSNAALLTLRNFTMSMQVHKDPNVDDATVTTEENLTGSITTDAANQQLVVLVQNESEDTVRTKQVVTDGNGDATFSFTPITIDQADTHFTVIATHPATGTVAAQWIKVSQIDHEAGFDTTAIVAHRGDVVDIPILMSPHMGDKVGVNNATVTIGGPDVGYTANVTVYDWNNDRTVVLHWNTYTANGTTGPPEFSVEPNKPRYRQDALTVDSVSTSVAGGPSDVLDPGLYEVTVRSGAHTANQPANETIGILLTDRSTRSLSAWTAPGGSDVPLSSVSDVLQAEADGNLSRSRTIASGDRLVLALNATGLQGAIQPTPKANPPTAFADFVGSGATFTSVQTNGGTNADPTVLNLSDPSTSRVLADPANDTYYVVLRPDEVPAASDANGDGNVSTGDPATSIAGGDRFNTTFTIPGTDGGLAAHTQRATIHWRYATADASVNTTRVDGSDVVRVEPSANRTVSGTTNVAPGTQLELRVRADPPNVSFFHAVTVPVTANGTWSHEFNFTGAANGTTFTVSVRRGSTVLATANGVVRNGTDASATETTGTAAAAQSTTETPTTAVTTTSETITTERTTTAGTTEQKTTTTPPATETTGTRTPGLTVGIAVAALSLAFLLDRRFRR